MAAHAHSTSPESNAEQDENAFLEIGFDTDLTLFSTTNPADHLADVYIWDMNDAQPGRENSEHISMFIAGKGGDILQINDLGTRQAKDLERFISLYFDGQDTVLEIRPDSLSPDQPPYYITLDKLKPAHNTPSPSATLKKLIEDGNLDLNS